jgi:hypothetical protein
VSTLEENPNLPNDGFRKVKKPMTPEERARRFGDALKPLPPTQKPRVSRAREPKK